MENHDILTVISNEDGLTFASKREWHRLHTDDLSALDGFAIVGNMIGSVSVYIILRNMNPLSWEISQDKLKLLKIVTDEETGKIDFYTMDLNAAETEAIRKHKLTFWE